MLRMLDVLRPLERALAARTRIPSWAVVMQVGGGVALVVALIGFVWDVGWHGDLGRDKNLFTMFSADWRHSLEHETKLRRWHSGRRIPFRPVSLDPARRTPAVVALARAAYDERLMPLPGPQSVE